MKHIIRSKKTGHESTVTVETWADYVRRGIAKNFAIVQRGIPDVPVEVAEVVEKMKKKAAKTADNNKGEPGTLAPDDNNQNEETE